MLTCFIGEKLEEVRFVSVYFFGGLECVSHSFVCVAHFVFLRDVWNLTQRAAVASRLATNLATLKFVVSVQRYEHGPQTRQK